MIAATIEIQLTWSLNLELFSVLWQCPFKILSLRFFPFKTSCCPFVLWIPFFFRSLAPFLTFMFVISNELYAELINEWVIKQIKQKPMEIIALLLHSKRFYLRTQNGTNLPDRGAARCREAETQFEFKVKFLKAVKSVEKFCWKIQTNIWTVNSLFF